jgi:hypothetical protein
MKPIETHTMTICPPQLLTIVLVSHMVCARLVGCYLRYMSRNGTHQIRHTPYVTPNIWSVKEGAIWSCFVFKFASSSTLCGQRHERLRIPAGDPGSRS